MAITLFRYADTLSVLCRKRNRREITPETFAEAKTLLKSDILLSRTFDMLELDETAIRRGLPFIERHNINAADAAILVLYLRTNRSPAYSGTTFIFIASNKRLLRAAETEGLSTLDPETVSPVEAQHICAA